MREKVKRTLNLRGITYELQKDKKVFANTKYTWGILLRKIKFNIGERKYVLYQKNMLLKLINIFPLFYCRSFPNYILKLESKVVGKTYCCFLKKYHSIKYNNSLYAFFLEKNNHVLIYKDEVKVADIKKNNLSYNGNNEYEIDFLVEEEKDIVLIIAVYSDIVFFSSHFNYSGIKMEKTI